MLTRQEKTLIRRGLNGLAQQLPTYRERREQLRMIGTIVKAIAAGCDAQAPAGANIAVVEAPTGTGKSFGISLAAIVMGRMRDTRVVVSTSTVALMHQLLAKDLPLLARAVPIQFAAAGAKARSRYVCPAKLATLPVERRAAVPIDPAARALRRISAQFAAGTWDGDRDALDEAVPDALWRTVTNDAFGCAGSHCPSAARCPYMLARKRIDAADVVVTNHAYVAAAIVDGDVGALPPVEESVLIFDEAHALPRYAIGAKTTKVGLRQTLAAIDAMPDLARRVTDGLRLGSTLASDTADRVVALQQQIKRLETAAGQSPATDRSCHRIPPGALRAELAPALRAARDAGDALLIALEALRARVVEHSPHETQAALQVLGWLSVPARRVRALTQACAMFLDDRPAASEPPARWLEFDRAHADMLLCAAPLSAAPTLQQALWSRARAAVATSATLSFDGSFDVFLAETGLRAMRPTRVMSLPSPYRHFDQSTVLVPRMRSDPRDVAAHTAEVAALLPELIHSDGTLVLFASDAQMRAVRDALPVWLREITIMQGEQSKAALLNAHRARIASGQRSVIFGLAAMAEGLDLPRRECEHVIIAKLPFEVPTNPWEQARAEAMRAQRRSYFDESVIPAVGLRLVQAAGRLVRSETDRGVVTILDQRIATSRWGQRLLRTLPPMRREILPADWRRVITRHQAAVAALPLAA